MYKYKNQVITESDIDAFNNSTALEWLLIEYEKTYRSVMNQELSKIISNSKQI